MKKLLFLCCLLTALFGWAQTGVPKQKPAFYSANQVGLLEGAAGSAFLVQTVNGMQYKGWAAGLGIGIDKYRDRSVPLFVQVRRSVLEKRLPLYIYADGGINMPWPLQRDEMWQSRDYKNGLYMDAGLQYQWRITQRQAILISAGYSEKRHAWQINIPSFCIDGTCPDQKNSWQYTYRRVAIKAGWKF